LKYWHQHALHNAVQFGDLEFSKVEFLAALQSIRNRTFRKATILSAWKKAGLFPFEPEMVFKKMKEFDVVESTTETVRPVTRPVTPPSKPFTQPPTTATRAAHSKYLDM
jgi:hypothetical protein